MKLWAWIEQKVLGSRCPKCGAKEGWSTKDGKVWECLTCGHTEQSKV